MTFLAALQRGMKNILVYNSFVGNNLVRVFRVKRQFQRQGRCAGVFTVNFEHISYLFVVFLLLNLNKQILAG